MEPHTTQDTSESAREHRGDEVDRGCVSRRGGFFSRTVLFPGVTFFAAPAISSARNTQFRDGDLLHCGWRGVCGCVAAPSTM